MVTLTESQLANIRSHIRSGVTRDIIEVIGVEMTMLLIYKSSGLRLSVPIKARKSKLEELIGTESAILFCKEYARAVLEIPNEKKALTIWLRYHGYSLRSIAHEMRITYVLVKRYLISANIKLHRVTKHHYSPSIRHDQ